MRKLCSLRYCGICLHVKKHITHDREVMLFFYVLPFLVDQFFKGRPKDLIDKVPPHKGESGKVQTAKKL